MQKFFLFIIIAVILGGGYYFYAARNKQALAPTVENGQAIQKQEEGAKDEAGVAITPSQNQNTLTPSPLPQGEGEKKEAQGTFSGGEGEPMGPDVLVVQIDYDGSKFTPLQVDIKAGDIIIFKNNSSGQMWPASAPHPIHTDYAEFDAKQPIEAGGKWQFKFDKTGKWRFHDHLNPSAFGLVNVTSK